MNRRTPQAFRPSVDGLEYRIALSTTQAAVVSGMTRSGSLTGNYFAPGGDNRPADAPLEVNLSGSGSGTGLGRFGMTGSLRMGGLLPAGVPNITGKITIRNARGSITLRLTGADGNGEVPGGKFRWKAAVVGGTGVYSNLRDAGTAKVSFGPNLVQSIVAPSPIGGTMTMDLRLGPR